MERVAGTDRVTLCRATLPVCAVIAAEAGSEYSSMAPLVNTRAIEFSRSATAASEIGSDRPLACASITRADHNPDTLPRRCSVPRSKLAIH